MHASPFYSSSDVLPVVAVIAVAAVAAIAISAWLVLAVARRAIEKADPESIASVVLALGALLNPIRLFFPWNSRNGFLGARPETHVQGQLLPYDDNPESSKEAQS
jgi:hypothetical protein